MLKDNTPFEWKDKQIESFEQFEQILCSEPILQYPNFTKPFLIITDASKYAIGGVLSQGKIGEDLPISYYSKTLSDTEVRYSTIEKELLAIVYSTKYFRPYIYAKELVLITDQRPLVWLSNLKDPESKLARWRIKLNEYTYIT